MITAQLSFHGAAQGVTGSCHLLELAGCRILVDCGLFQGGRELSEDNAEPFGFDPASIDVVLLTHAHLDHCGRIPLLVKRGFRGEIIATAPTRELARIVMLDSAHLQDEEARRSSRQAHRRGNGNHTGESLYSLLDVLNCLDRFGRIAAYGKPIKLAQDVSATFHDAGHILGSASIVVEMGRSKAKRRVLFSGDLGNAGRPLLPPPGAIGHVDTVVMETTYGDRKHRDYAASVAELYQAINETFARGGNVIIPTFALERAQEILFCLRQGIEQRVLQGWVNVFLDSPMAISATEIYRRYPESFMPNVVGLFGHGDDPFSLPGLHLTRDAESSMAINRINGGAIIMAGSGMCTGGRVRHHLKHNLWRNDCSIIFIGYAAQGTLARRLIDGAKTVRLFGEEIKVGCRIHTINGFSAHADRSELLDWHGKLGNPAQTFLVHGDQDAMKKFESMLAARNGGRQIEMPHLHQSFALG